MQVVDQREREDKPTMPQLEKVQEILLDFPNGTLFDSIDVMQPSEGWSEIKPPAPRPAFSSC